MNVRIIYYLCIVLCSIISLSRSYCRSIHRGHSSKIPQLKINATGDKKTFRLASRYLEEYPWFRTFDRNYFMQHQLPNNPINYRTDARKSVSVEKLHDDIATLLNEIKKKKRHYSRFEILQNRDFSRRKQCGSLIVKFKHYPFVFKLFIETPKSLTKKWGKGIEQVYFFYLGGGVNRHLSGFTRLKNLEYLAQRLKKNPYWHHLVDVPRKWFWLPPEQDWLEIHGTNIGNQGPLYTMIPGTYGIIADSINAEKSLSLSNKQDRKLAISLCNFLQNQIDPHISNFMIEKETQKLVIIDTEHFPTMVGLKEPCNYTGYINWYAKLIKKCASDMIFSSKKSLLERQKKPKNAYSPLPFFATDQQTLDDLAHVAQYDQLHASL